MIFFFLFLSLILSPHLTPLFPCHTPHTPISLCICAGVSALLADNIGNTAAAIAAFNGNLDTVKLLTTRGKVNLDETGNTGNSLLIWAATFGKLDVVTYLAESGADVNIKNKEGKSALDMAYINGKSEVIAYLLRFGAKIY